jgi:hypothetical protein
MFPIYGIISVPIGHSTERLQCDNLKNITLSVYWPNLSRVCFMVIAMIMTKL